MHMGSQTDNGGAFMADSKPHQKDEKKRFEGTRAHPPVIPCFCPSGQPPVSWQQGNRSIPVSRIFRMAASVRSSRFGGRNFIWNSACPRAQRS